MTLATKLFFRSCHDINGSKIKNEQVKVFFPLDKSNSSCSLHAVAVLVKTDKSIYKNTIIFENLLQQYYDEG